MRIVDEPPPPFRKTKYPWRQWSQAKWIELRKGEDFFDSPQKVARAYNAYARRQEFAGRAIVRRDVDEAGQPVRFVFVWGDLTRPKSEGFPDGVAEIR